MEISSNVSFLFLCVVVALLPLISGESRCSEAELSEYGQEYEACHAKATKKLKEETAAELE